MMQGICIFVAAVTMLTTPAFLLVWLVRKLRKKPAGQVKRAALISAACFAVFTVVGGLTDPDAADRVEKENAAEEVSEKKEEEPSVEVEVEVETPNEEEGAADWADAFVQAGFTQEEIDGYREIIETVGVAELNNVEIIENGIMHIVRGNIYDSSNLQMNMTLENREIIYIELAGIPDVKNVPYINWRGKIKNKKVDTVTSVELYSDTEGGYEGVLVWEDKFIYPCDTDGKIVEK